MNISLQSRQIQWVEVNGRAGVVACARAGHSKSAWLFRRNRGGAPPIWIASINSTGLGEFLEREIAMRRVEELVESSMVLVLHDWELYQAAKGKR
jgi:hypothetical protein